MDEVSKIQVTPSEETDPTEGPPTVEEIIVDIATIHYGRGKDDPMKTVSFYSKRQPFGSSSLCNVQ